MAKPGKTKARSKKYFEKQKKIKAVQKGAETMSEDLALHFLGLLS